MQKVLAYCLAGAILLVMADSAPKIATGTTALILLGVALTHGSELAAAGNFIQKGTSS